MITINSIEKSDLKQLFESRTQSMNQITFFYIFPCQETLYQRNVSELQSMPFGTKDYQSNSPSNRLRTAVRLYEGTSAINQAMEHMNSREGTRQ